LNNGHLLRVGGMAFDYRPGGKCVLHTPLLWEWQDDRSRYFRLCSNHL